ncbi:MAG: YceI family protein [Hyphomicrobium sp.]|jgi:polyisoprenoid-binding protein YceI
MSVYSRTFAGHIIAGLVTAVALLSGSAQAAPYRFDTTSADVRFAYTMGFSDGQGRFTGVTGTAEINDATPARSAVDVTIDTRTLKSADSLAQGQLRGASFFAVATYPQMHFKSRTIRGTSPTTFEITGDMTVKGITKPIVLQVELQLPNKSGVRQMRATTRIRRSQFGMDALSFLVGDIVLIEIRSPLVAVR